MKDLLQHTSDGVLRKSYSSRGDATLRIDVSDHSASSALLATTGLFCKPSVDPVAGALQPSHQFFRPRPCGSRAKAQTAGHASKSSEKLGPRIWASGLQGLGFGI